MSRMRALFLSSIGLVIATFGAALLLWVDEDFAAPFLAGGGFMFLALSYRALFGHAAAEAQGFAHSVGRILYGVFAICAVLAVVAYVLIRKNRQSDVPVPSPPRELHPP